MRITHSSHPPRRRTLNLRRFEMEIMYSVEMPRATVRAAAQILESLAVMHYGIRVMVSEELDKDFAWYREKVINAVQGRWPYEMMGAGYEALAGSGWLDIPAVERYVTAQALLHTPSP